jgi:hypothetical protein
VLLSFYWCGCPALDHRVCGCPALDHAVCGAPLAETPSRVTCGGMNGPAMAAMQTRATAWAMAETLSDGAGMSTLQVTADGWAKALLPVLTDGPGMVTAQVTAPGVVAEPAAGTAAGMMAVT